MGEDLSTGAKIGIILIILVALIGIVFALLTIMKNITNSGSNQLQNSLDQMQQSGLSDYDQKIVTGTNVLTALKTYEAQDMAIVIKNTLSDSMKKAGKAGHIGGFCYNALLVGYDKDEPDTMPSYGKVYYTDNQVNYVTNQYLDSVVATYSAGDELSDVGIKMSDTGTYYVGEFAKINGTQVKFNLNTKPVGASGSQTYVRGSSSYRANLIKDASGTTIGVCFVEMDKS